MAISNVMSQSLISASSSMKMARMQNGVKKQMEGHAGVLRAEIKQDGGNDPKKQKELEETEEKAAKVETSTMNTLSDMNKDLRAAAKQDQEEIRAEKAAEKKKAEKAAEKKKAEKKAQEERLEKAAQAKIATDVDGTEVSAETKTTDSAGVSGSISVDITSEGVTPSTDVATTVGAKVDVKA